MKTKIKKCPDCKIELQVQDGKLICPQCRYDYYANQFIRKYFIPTLAAK